MTEIDVENHITDIEGRLTHLEAELTKLEEKFNDHLVNCHNIEVIEK